MIGCYLHNGSFSRKRFGSLSEIVSSIEKNRKALWKMPGGAIIEILNQLSGEVIRDQELRGIEGGPFLAMWLKRKNLEDIVRINIGKNYLDGYADIRKNHLIKAQPRGIVCHWIAGNIPTLAAFSLFQSVLTKNGNILRVPKTNIEAILKLLKKLNTVRASWNGTTYYGRDIVKTISLVHFDSTDKKYNTMLSLVADCKVIWGGKQAVESIVALPQREWCETIIFGPKYSFGAVDRATIDAEGFEDVLEAFSKDIIAFEQAACSSPHVIFFEKSGWSIGYIAERFAEQLKKASRKYPKSGIDQYTASKIINKRAEYYLDPEKGIIAPMVLDWTILINFDLALEEPIQSRTIFIKEVESIFDVIPLITKKVQTIGIAVENMENRIRFSNMAAYRGVARCVRPGTMNDYEAPWDGILFLNRLVRWCSIIS